MIGEPPLLAGGDQLIVSEVAVRKDTLSTMFLGASGSVIMTAPLPGSEVYESP
jgi:hypothetical protein